MFLFQRKPKCPNCDSTLNEMPKRKQKCPHCGKEMVVRSGKLVTEEEAAITEWIEKLEHFGINKVKFDQTRERLTKKFKQQANVNDTIWGILNELIIKYGADKSALEQIYRNMSSLVSSEGKDPTPYLLEAEKAKKAKGKEILKTSSNLEELNHALDQILFEDKSNLIASDAKISFTDQVSSGKSSKDSIDNEQESQKVFLGQDELALVRKLRNEDKLDQAEKLLLKGEPSPAVLDELRKISSTKARIAKKKKDWGAVIQHLESYTTYANQWREYCLKMVNQEPPDHTESDKRLLQEAKEKNSK